MKNIFDFEFDPTRRRRRPTSEPPTRPPKNAAPTALAETNLGLRLINLLEGRGILTVDQLGDVPDDVIAEYLKAGRQTRAEVYALLVSRGLREPKHE